jgi:hypothetical protein
MLQRQDGPHETKSKAQAALRDGFNSAMNAHSEQGGHRGQGRAPRMRARLGDAVP